ncbi:glyoxalase [Stenotrophomonas sp. HITSZ_GD]|uniref:VOC family protein n=1 Tax=Stenotrophomonas sp. HITSZ_GD TaxID=3037248 RepID=UPI00240DB4FC|nr:glyoxalase [Stenotrophomonas sp. HITSZ_GD]MDG2524233.1 glyoxalase [Stenotrophomonas sp. HITSZ_GD]
MKSSRSLLIALLALVPGLASPEPARQPAAAAPRQAVHAVGPQYDTTHVYVAPEDFDRFVRSFVATFGGTTSKQGVFQVTPTSSQTMSQLVLTPVGTVSVFGFKTPVPYPFGAERTGYLVRDIDAATSAAVAHGATRLVDVFPDPIGRDVLVQWPGGVNMQFYWHTTPPSYAALTTVPENRVYLTADAADAFLRRWLAFSQGRVVSDEPAAPGAEIGRPGTTVRRVLIESGFGKLLVLVSDGQLPWPYGRDLTGYEVQDLAATLERARQAGAEVLVPPYPAGGRQAAMVRFPGGYIAELHQPGAEPR